MFRTKSPNPHKIKNEERRKDKSKETKEQTEEEEEEEEEDWCALLPTMVAELMGFQAFRPGLDFTEKREPKRDTMRSG